MLNSVEGHVRPPASKTDASTEASTGFYAVVLAVEPVTQATVCGLTLAERGRRVAQRAGASHVVVIDSASSAAKLPEGAKGNHDLLVVQVRDQVVHSPLVDAVRPSAASPNRDIAVAIDPDDGEYAGAMWIPAAHAAAALDTLSVDPVGGDRALAKQWLADDLAHGNAHADIARHPAATRQDRRGATSMLFRLVHKPQDSVLSTYVNRRVSYPFTRLFLPTPITPNMLSIMVFFIGLAGCWFVSRGSYDGAVLGCSLVLFAGYLDGCDGEIARLRHEGSKFGAWLDTIVDEITTLVFFVAAGLHYYAHAPAPWVATSIVVGATSIAIGIYIIYYYLIVVAKSGNSQDYPTSSGGVLDYLRLMVKRDFINLSAVVLAIAGLTRLTYLGLLTGSIVAVVVLVPQHIALRMSRRANVDDDGEPELASSSSGTFTKL